jgi:hypothetical protein
MDPTIKALSWKDVEEIAGRFESLNCYDRTKVPGSILKIEKVNFDAGKQIDLFGFASAPDHRKHGSKKANEQDCLHHPRHSLSKQLSELIRCDISPVVRCQNFFIVVDGCFEFGREVIPPAEMPLPQHSF